MLSDTVTLTPIPESGIRLPGLLRAAGAVDIHVEMGPLVITSLATHRAIRSPDGALKYLVMRPQVEADRAARLPRRPRGPRPGRLVLEKSLLYIVSGRKAAVWADSIEFLER